MTSVGRVSFVVLCAALLLATVLFGPPTTYSDITGMALAAVQLIVILAAAWKAGFDLAWTGTEATRERLLGAGLLIVPVASFSLLAGYGPPEFADHARNVFRYEVLLVDAVAVSVGFVVLVRTITGGGERIFSGLSLALILCATPLYLVWATLLLAGHRALLAGESWAAGPWTAWLNAMSDILLFFGSLFTYLATSALALAFYRAGWIGRSAAAAASLASLALAACLISRGLTFPDPSVVFAEGYSVPGWIAGIPAVPWLVPCVLGLAILRRADH